MESLQIYIPVYSIAVLNATCVGNPVLCNSSIEFEIKLLVTGTAKNAFIVSNYNHKGWRVLLPAAVQLRWIRSHYKKLSLIMYHSLLWCMLFHWLNSCFLLLTSLLKYSWKDLFYFCNSACMEFWKYQGIQLCDAFFTLSRWDILLWLASGFVYLQKCLMLLPEH